MEMVPTSPVDRLVELIQQGRVPQLTGEDAPWELSIVEMGKAVRDHTSGEIDTAIGAVRDHVSAHFDRQLAEHSNRLAAQIGPAIKREVEIALKPIREEVAALKLLIEALPLVVRAAIEGVPEVVVQTPQPDRVVKDIQYDDEKKPVHIVEERVYCKS